MRVTIPRLSPPVAPRPAVPGTDPITGNPIPAIPNKKAPPETTKKQAPTGQKKPVEPAKEESGRSSEKEAGRAG